MVECCKMLRNSLQKMVECCKMLRNSLQKMVECLRCWEILCERQLKVVRCWEFLSILQVSTVFHRDGQSENDSCPLQQVCSLPRHIHRARRWRCADDQRWPVWPLSPAPPPTTPQQTRSYGCQWSAEKQSTQTWQLFNLLALGRFELNFRWLVFKLILVIHCWGISCEIALRWMSLELTNVKSTLVQVMAWCLQATSHYLSQCKKHLCHIRESLLITLRLQQNIQLFAYNIYNYIFKNENFWNCIQIT